MHDLDRIREAARHYESGVRDPDCAEATARAALRACRDALDILVARLRDEGFPTSIPGRIAVDPRDVERAVALLPERPPRVLQLFWEEVGAVCLADSREYSRNEYVHADFFDSRGMVGGSPDGTTDPLWVDGPEPDWIEYLGDDVER